MTYETPAQKALSPFAQALKDELATINKLREGEVAQATLIKKTPRAAYFSIGRFGTGIVFGTELQGSRDVLKNLNVGDQIAAKVGTVEGYLGYTELSLTEAGKQKAWQEVKTLEESGELASVKVAGANQGGLLVDLLGLKGFLPISQLSPEHTPDIPDGDRFRTLEELKKFVGQELSVKIIMVNARANKLIVSERDNAASSASVKELLGKYEVGQVVPGVVSGIADFGIFVRFVDNPEIEGLVHISEIDHRIIDNPKEILKLNETVQVKIIDIKEGRVFLSLKALKADPWLAAHEKYKEGQDVRGKVYKFNPFGAIIDLDGGLQGLIHVSEYGGIDEMKKVLAVGEPCEFTVGSIKQDEKRIVLKAKK